jgi:hypothetical protein
VTFEEVFRTKTYELKKNGLISFQETFPNYFYRRIPHSTEMDTNINIVNTTDSTETISNTKSYAGANLRKARCELAIM